MSRCHFLAGLLAVSLAVGCKAQPALPNSPDLDVNRRIEVMVRSQFNVPQDYNVAIGARKPSHFTGYDTLPVTLSRGTKSQRGRFPHLHRQQDAGAPGDLRPDQGSGLHIDVAGRPIRGNPAAKVTVINFDDLECPYCARMHQSLFPTTLERYKDKVRFIYKDDPLTELHPWAMHAAVDANCLAAQSGDVYWTYVDYLHAHGQEITGDDRDLDQELCRSRPHRPPGSHAGASSMRPSSTPASPSRTKRRCALRQRKRKPWSGWNSCPLC